MIPCARASSRSARRRRLDRHGSGKADLLAHRPHRPIRSLDRAGVLHARLDAVNDNAAFRAPPWDDRAGRRRAVRTAARGKERPRAPDREKAARSYGALWKKKRTTVIAARESPPCPLLTGAAASRHPRHERSRSHHPGYKTRHPRSRTPRRDPLASVALDQVWDEITRTFLRRRLPRRFRQRPPHPPRARLANSCSTSASRRSRADGARRPSSKKERPPDSPPLIAPSRRIAPGGHECIVRVSRRECERLPVMRTGALLLLLAAVLTGCTKTPDATVSTTSTTATTTTTTATTDNRSAAEKAAGAGLRARDKAEELKREAAQRQKTPMRQMNDPLECGSAATAFVYHCSARTYKSEAAAAAIQTSEMTTRTARLRFSAHWNTIDHRVSVRISALIG